MTLPTSNDRHHFFGFGRAPRRKDTLLFLWFLFSKYEVVQQKSKDALFLLVPTIPDPQTKSQVVTNLFQQLVATRTSQHYCTCLSHHDGRTD